MNLHEYQAKELLAAKGVSIPRGSLCYDPFEALLAARGLKSERVVLKAQVHSGGRGKAGGVAVLSMSDDIRSKAGEILGSRLVTNQTGPEGKPVSALLVEEVMPIGQELYLGVVLDRISGLATIMASAEGGVEIETLAREAPEKILTIGVDPLRGLAPHQARSMAYKLTDNRVIADQLTKTVTALYGIF
ncbi:MAG: acetate--CoA ligase family protein, partial [Desulfomonile tiedjei]|nr:acetate--CoA ligase family protein [Desulfomonile tiedjei]